MWVLSRLTPLKVDLRNFEEVGIHKKLKRIHILHEGGSPKYVDTLAEGWNTGSHLEVQAD